MTYNFILSVVVGLVTVAGALYVTKYIVSELQRQVEAIFKRLEKHGDDLVALNTKSELAVTAKDVDEKYQSKELFRQYEKHIDSRFDRLEQGQGKIFEYIKNVK